MISNAMLQTYPQISKQKIILNLLYCLSSKHLVLFLKEKRERGMRGVSSNQVIIQHHNSKEAWGPQ